MSSHHKTRSFSHLHINKLALYTVTDKPILSHRGKTASLQLSPKQKKLQEDFEIFQFLKTERGGQQYMTQITQEKPIQKSPGTRKLKKTAKSFAELRLQRYQNEMMQIQQRRKAEMLNKAQTQMHIDIKDIQKMTQKGKEQFTERIALYSKYFSQELLENEGKYRQEDLQMPLKKHSSVENENTFRRIFKYTPRNIEMKDEREEFNKYLGNEQKINGISDQLRKTNIKIRRKVNNLEQEFMHKILTGEVQQVKNMLDMNENLLNCRNYKLETPLHLAVKRNNLEIIELLVNKNIDQNKKDLWGRSAKDVGLQCQHFDALKILYYRQ